ISLENSLVFFIITNHHPPTRYSYSDRFLVGKSTNVESRAENGCRYPSRINSEWSQAILANIKEGFSNQGNFPMCARKFYWKLKLAFPIQPNRTSVRKDD